MKIYYKPPKVKPRKNKNKPLPEWNDSINNLDKFKLTSTQILKKKINSVSKNLEIAKKDLNENIQKIGTQVSSEPKIKNKNESYIKQRSRVSSSNFNRERSLSNQKIRKKSYGGEKFMRQKSNEKYKSPFNHNTMGIPMDDDEIYLINNPQNIKINSTKIEKVIEKPTSKMTKTNFLLDDELSEKMRILEENLLKREKNNPKEKMNNREFDHIKAQITNEYLRDNFESNKNHQFQDEENEVNVELEEYQDNDDYNDHVEDDEIHDITEYNDNLKKKFNNLSDIDNSMKKLNDILDYSSKSSIKFKFETDIEFKNKQSNDRIGNYESNKYNQTDQHNNNVQFNEVKTELRINDLKIKDETSEPKPYSFNNIKTNNPPSKKSIEIHRKVIDIDNKNMRNDIYDEKEQGELDYIKNLLMKTKSELDKLGNKFNNKEDEEEIEPRLPPQVLSNYNKNFN